MHRPLISRAGRRGRFLGLAIAGTLLLWITVSWFPGSNWAEAREPAAPTTLQTDPSFLERFTEQVAEFRLDNGIQFIVLGRHQAPVVSMLTYADVGAVNEPVGKTGVAHFLEHLAFKGTQHIGTKNYETERKLLRRLDQLKRQLKRVKTQGEGEKAAQLRAEFEQVQSEAANYVEQNELARIVDQAGGVGLNAATSTDATRYFYSFPSNKLELWMSLESERFLEPVFRGFYEEQQVILEERRLRVDNSPIGQMIESLVGTAFQVHPYRRPVIGYEADIRNLTRPDVRDFFETHYVPRNLTFAIVGDVEPAEVKRLAQVYFGRFEARQIRAENIPVEPVQQTTREVTLRLPAQPWYLEAYHRPDIRHPDDVVYQLIASLLSDGRLSRLYQSLVVERQVALSAEGLNGFPGDKFPNLVLFYALTAPNHTVDEVAVALQQELERLKTEPVTVQELDRLKTQAKARLLRSLKSNLGMAKALAEYEVKTGSWRNLFREVDAIAAVTAADVQRVAQETFRAENRTVGRLLPQE